MHVVGFADSAYFASLQLLSNGNEQAQKRCAWLVAGWVPLLCTIGLVSTCHDVNPALTSSPEGKVRLAQQQALFNALCQDVRPCLADNHKLTHSTINDHVVANLQATPAITSRVSDRDAPLEPRTG
jgi:hypothetical protein